MGRLTLLVLFGLVACAPYRPPAGTPPLVVARGAVRVVGGGAEARYLLVRAGSAYDPPGREGLAAVLAHGLAARAGVHADVGPERVLFPLGPHAEALAVLLAQPVDEATLEAGLAAVRGLVGADCAALVDRLVETWVFAGHPYGHPATGRPGALETLTVGELEAFRRLRYVRDAAIVVGPAEVALRFEPAFPAALSRSPTPAVWNRAARAELTVHAPVPAGCDARGVRTVRDWSAVDEAMARVLAASQGGPPLALRVEPVLLVRGEAEWSAAAVQAASATLQFAVSSGLDAAERTLLGQVRGAQVPDAGAVAAALAGVDQAGFDAWVARRFAGAVGVHIVPAGAESPAPAGVQSYEALLR